MWSDFVLKWSDVKWVTVKFLGTKLPCTLRWPYTEGIWLYCYCFIWCVILYCDFLTCFVMCECVYSYVWVFWQLCGCFGNTCTCIYCVLYCLYHVFVVFRLCIFILTCFVCTSVKTIPTEWQLYCSSSSSSSSSSSNLNNTRTTKLRHQSEQQDAYHNSGVYKLEFKTCGKVYVGQTGCTSPEADTINIHEGKDTTRTISIRPTPYTYSKQDTTMNPCKIPGI